MKYKEVFKNLKIRCDLDHVQDVIKIMKEACTRGLGDNDQGDVGSRVLLFITTDKSLNTLGLEMTYGGRYYQETLQVESVNMSVYFAFQIAYLSDVNIPNPQKCVLKITSDKRKWNMVVSDNLNSNISFNLEKLYSNISEVLEAKEMAEPFLKIKTPYLWSDELITSMKAGSLGSLVKKDQDDNVHIKMEDDTTHVCRFNPVAISIVTIHHLKTKHKKSLKVCFPTYLVDTLSDISSGEKLKFGLSGDGHYIKAVSKSTTFISPIVIKDFNDMWLEQITSYKPTFKGKVNSKDLSKLLKSLDSGRNIAQRKNAKLDMSLRKDVIEIATNMESVTGGGKIKVQRIKGKSSKVVMALSDLLNITSRVSGEDIEITLTEIPFYMRKELKKNEEIEVNLFVYVTTVKSSSISKKRKK